MAKKNTLPAEPGLHANLWLLSNSQNAFAGEQLQLLQAIATTGSISAAAKAVGISYKTAWDRVNAINNMSAQPLVSRNAGGVQGGGTSLTAYGERILSGFVNLQSAHQEFIQQLSRKVQSFEDVASFMHSNQPQTSIRNQFHGRVSHITDGAVNSEILVDIGAAAPLTIMISLESRRDLQLRTEDTVTVLVDAQDLILTLEGSLQTSARNRIGGVISRIEYGAVNCELTLDIGEHKTLVVMITRHSAEALQLKTGINAWALFKASAPVLIRT